MNNDLPMPQQLTFDEELAEIKPYYLVNQANDLINSRQDLSLTAVNERSCRELIKSLA